jgi:hypothetical protein
MIGNPNLHIPKDITTQCGDFEKSVLAQSDAKKTDFEDPFDLINNLSRCKNAYWLKSDSIGKAFKICTTSRKIIDILDTRKEDTKMITFKSHPTLEAIKASYKLTSGILEITSENKVNFCRHEDDPVIIQIGWVTNDGFDVDSELAAKAVDIHTQLNRYFEGGCHDGISMLVLSFDNNNEGYSIYGDDNDDECKPVSVESKTFDSLVEAIGKL